MMTEQRKRRLRDKIQESRERLMKNYPFLAMLLMYVKYVAVREMKKMSTNARCIYFSPDFLDKLRTSELDYLLAHQVMHIVLLFSTGTRSLSSTGSLQLRVVMLTVFDATFWYSIVGMPPSLLMVTAQ